MSRLLDKKYLPIKLLSIEAEGFSYFPRQEIIVHKGISILNGENGSGKTTFLNMLRVLFGVKTMDNKQYFKSFFEREDVDEIYILGRMDNTIHPEARRRPFEAIGKKEDIVTIVCRLKNDQQIRRDYLIYDGLFDLDVHLKESVRWLETGQYQKQMSEVGMSRSLVNAFSLNQGNTEKILELSEEELANYLLDICGEQEMIEKFQQIKADLKRQKDQYNHLARQKQQEEYSISQITQKIERIKKINTYQKEIEHLEFEKPLAQLVEQQKHVNKLVLELENVQLDLKSVQEQVSLFKEELAQKMLLDKQLEDQLQIIHKEIDKNKSEFHQLKYEIIELKRELEELHQFLSKYGDISPIPLEELEQKKQKYEQEHRRCLVRSASLEEQKIKLECTISEIEKNKEISYPASIQKIKEWLKEEGIEHLLLAECVEITDSEWREAIEALLGQERFTILVSPDKMVQVMRWAQKHQHSYWISPYAKVALKIQPQSVLQKISVLDERITGYLQRFEKCMVAQSVAEAWNWVKKGHEALVHHPHPYLVVARGGRTIASKGLYCGKKAYEAQLQQLHSTLNELLSLWQNALQLELNAKQYLENALTAIEEQVNVRKVPEIKEDLINKLAVYNQKKDELSKYEVQLLQLGERRNLIQDQSGKLKLDIGGLDRDIKNGEGKYFHLESYLEQKSNQLKDEKEKQNTLEAQLSQEQREFMLDEEKLINLRDVGWYNSEIVSYQRRIQDQINTGAPILPGDENLPFLEEKYRAHERLLQEHKAEIEKSEQELTKLENKHQEAQEEYMLMVEDVFLKVKRSLEEMASYGNIEAHLRPIYLGEDHWRVDYRIGFHGKQPVSYQVKNAFSGGQKVIASLLLILAAIKADGVLSFMLLDEPFAHLDRDRIQLAGEFLKKTGAQYIIAMPYTENVKLLMPWVDMSINLRPKKPDQEIAPPITYGVINDDYIKRNSLYKASS